MSSPAISRSTLVRGAGSLQYGNAKLFSKEEIVASVEIESWKPTVATHGEDTPRVSDATAEIKFTPTGRLTQTILDILYPQSLRNPIPGSRLFPNADVVLKVHGMDGVTVNFANACPVAMPPLTLSPTATAIGEAVFKALVKDNTPRETAGSFYTIAAEAWAETFDPNSIITCPYRCFWGTTELFSKEGFKFTFEVEVEAIKVDGIGTIDFSLKGVSVQCAFTPVNMTVAALMAALRPEGLVLGSTLRQGKNLRVAAVVNGGLYVQLYDAVVVTGDSQWKSDDGRIGDVTFRASRALVGSPASFGNLFELGLVVGVLSATITGTAQVGQTLTVAPNTGASGLSYQWQECATEEGTYVDIEGAEAATYVPSAEQVGKYLKAVISGENGSTATSAATAAVVAA